MTIVAGPGVLGPAAFGAGGSEPYDLAIRRGGGRLTLVSADDRNEHEWTTAILDVSAFLAEAGDDERRALAHSGGPVIDVGCGPGRIVRAAIDAGRIAMGVDVSRAAVAHARQQGLPVLRRSVFGRLPAEGSWGAVALFDGNIGIDGDPEALLARCAGLLRPGGTIVVEAHSERARDRRFRARLVDVGGGRSGPFAWAETGSAPIRRIAAGLGLTTTTATYGGRPFVFATR